MHISSPNWATSIGQQISEGGLKGKKKGEFNPFVYQGTESRYRKIAVFIVKSNE